MVKSINILFVVLFMAFLLLYTSTAIAQETNQNQLQEKEEIKPNIKIIRLQEIETIITEKRQGITIINLWATWCPPCVEELPFFGNIYKNYPKDLVHLYLINIEGKENGKKVVEPFLKKKPLPCPVYLLEDGTPEMIEKTLKTQISGALPVTLIYNSKGKLVKKFEEAITENTLNEILKNYGIEPIKKSE